MPCLSSGETVCNPVSCDSTSLQLILKHEILLQWIMDSLLDNVQSRERNEVCNTSILFVCPSWLCCCKIWIVRKEVPIRHCPHSKLKIEIDQNDKYKFVFPPKILRYFLSFQFISPVFFQVYFPLNIILF